MSRDAAYLSLGSNLGDRFAHLRGALDDLKKCPQIKLIAVSSLYETEPQDVKDQPWFLNMVAAITTDLSPEELLSTLQGIELTAGRVRQHGLRRGPRTLDIDILLFADVVMETATLTIPHPKMLERRFVLEPLVEIAPDLMLPGGRASFGSYLKEVSGQQLRCLRTDGSKCCFENP